MSSERVERFIASLGPVPGGKSREEQLSKALKVSIQALADCKKENERLREALNKIGREAPTKLTSEEWRPFDVSEIARAALEQEPE